MNKPKPINRRPDKTINDLIVFIEKGVQTFTSSSSYKNQYHEDSDEDHLTEILVWHYQEINRHDNENYIIIAQTRQENRRKVDIGIGLYGGEGDYIFCIEAKILPTNKYITGNTGAIKRFKKCEHGLSSFNPKNRKPLSNSCIVAYVKLGTFNEHLMKINGKIQEIASKHSEKPDEFGLTWYNSEQLEKIYFSSIARLISKHPRENSYHINLHHFWISVH